MSSLVVASSTPGPRQCVFASNCTHSVSPRCPTPLRPLPQLLISSEGVLKIADFGVAVKTGGATGEAAEGGDAMVGHALGTPAFHAPEVCAGMSKIDDAAVDIWALGVSF